MDTTTRSNAFTGTGKVTNAGALSWTVEQDSHGEPSHGTLVVLGDPGVSVGDRLTICGEEYIATNVTPSVEGANRVTTILVRDLLYDMYSIYSSKGIVWMTGPRRVVKGAQLEAVHQPILTEIRAKEGGVFGTGGWKMSEIVQECATLLGYKIEYTLPDFSVKQLELNRGVPIVSFLLEALAPLLPRCVFRSGTLYLKPTIGDIGAVGDTYTGIEATSVAHNLAEPYSGFRVWGGMAEFKSDKWEGKALLNSTGAGSTYQLTSTISVTALTMGSGEQKFYTVTASQQDVVVTEEVYARNPFGEEAFLIYRKDTTYVRKAPYVVSTEAELARQMSSARSTVLNTADITPETHYLKEVKQTVNVYATATTGVDWEQPLLLSTHTSRWMYLYWSSLFAPAAHSGTGAWPGTLDTAGQEGVPTTESRVIGVWSQDAYYERTDYVYERMPGGNTSDDDDDYVGGLLLEKNTVAVGQTQPVMPSHVETPDGVTRRDTDVDKRVRPSYLLTVSDVGPMDGYPGTGYILTLSSRKESYREVGWRVVAHTVNETRLEPRDMQWYDPVTGTPGEYPNILANYVFTTTTATIPYPQAPQTIVQKRAMQCYDEFSGTGTRFVEVTVPLVVDWKDIVKIAATVRAAHPQGNSLVSSRIRLPYYLKVSALVGGGSIVAGSYSVAGDGSISTELISLTEE